jgi:hypothetical protein
VKTADQGEVIGLFLEEKIERGMTLDETIEEIRRQGGLAYIPHPFDRMHSVPDYEHMLAVVDRIDAIEVFNSRVTFPNHNREAAEYAAFHGIPGIAASDAHSSFEIAMSVNALPAFSTAEELRAGLAQNEWRGSRSTVLIHLTTRYAVWSNIIRRWLGKETAAAPVLGPEPPRKVEQEPIDRPAPAELPDPEDPESTSERG